MLNRKIEDKKFCSLKTKMLRICVGLVLTMLLLCSFVFITGNIAISKMQSNMNMEGLFDGYYETLDSLQLSLLNYLNGVQVKTKELCNMKLSELLKQSQQMAGVFKHPQFVDNYYLTQAYTASVSVVLNNDENILSQNLLDAYNKTDHIKALIVNNSSRLSKIKQELINTSIAQFADSWNLKT
jgi:hypothetical protein